MALARMLVIEDDEDVARLEQTVLERAGYEVRVTSSGAEGLELADTYKPDVVVLDVGLPDISGLDVCTSLSNSNNCFILMVSGHSREQDILLGLGLGADDYITKPFRRSELIARVNAFLRRSRTQSAAGTRFGRFELNVAAHKLFRDGKEVELTAKEFRLLAYFVSRRGCALTRDDILNAVWGNSVMVTPRSIDRCVATLRAKIEPEPHSPAYIQTIRDIGYRFEVNAE
jgi:DNA-binding response OmpR family regulator